MNSNWKRTRNSRICWFRRRWPMKTWYRRI